MSFNIQAKIGADGSGFFRELNRVKQAASGLASSAISGFGIPLGAAAGAGALPLALRPHRSHARPLHGHRQGLHFELI